MQKEIDELLKQEYAAYLAMNDSEKKEFGKKIDKAWHRVYEDFMTLCEADVELAEIYDELKRIGKITAFDLRDCFSVYSHTENPDDPEMSEDVYVFSPAKLAEAKMLSENWAQEEKRIKDKIEEIKNSRFVPFREKKIAKLEKELELKKDIVKYYRECMKKQEEKEYYLDNASKLINPLKEKYVSKLEKYAKKVLEKHIKESPCIICVKHTSFISSSAHKRSYDMTVLNDYANRVNDATRKSLVNASKR